MQAPQQISRQAEKGLGLAALGLRPVCRAARAARIDSNGSVVPRVNQVNSRWCCPLKAARRWEPVRISPGTRVVT